jgi:predicted  nucleic acid-binding Zn-ribbon protein
MDSPSNIPQKRLQSFSNEDADSTPSQGQVGRVGNMSHIQRDNDNLRRENDSLRQDLQAVATERDGLQLNLRWHETELAGAQQRIAGLDAYVENQQAHDQSRAEYITFLESELERYRPGTFVSQPSMIANPSN